jgi:t-SNARE complex subunit (syntaxin)
MEENNKTDVVLDTRFEGKETLGKGVTFGKSAVKDASKIINKLSPIHWLLIFATIIVLINIVHLNLVVAKLERRTYCVNGTWITSRTCLTASDE